MVFSLLNSYREEKDWPSLLNLGSCGSILITNSFKLECRQVNEICGKFSLITLYQRKYICELVKLMLSYWGNSLLKFCCWHTSKYSHHWIMTTSSTLSGLLWGTYSAVYFALHMKPPIKLILTGQFFFLWLKCYLIVKFCIMKKILERGQWDTFWEMNLWNMVGKIG